MTSMTLSINAAAFRTCHPGGAGLVETEEPGAAGPPAQGPCAQVAGYLVISTNTIMIDIVILAAMTTITHPLTTATEPT